MIETGKILKGFSTAESRWARFGPYYAMFPLEFAFKVVEKYSKEGDYIIDPFAGRCSSIYAGGVLGRSSLGIEINPVGWLYGTVKLQPASKEEVIDRLLEIYGKRNYYKVAANKMDTFYKMCYCNEVLKFLLAARKHLDWKNNDVDATLMSILLIYLHAKIGEGLSNQMRMTKSMGMKYSVDWWRKNKMTKPPKLNPCEFIIKKINWRYEKGTPSVTESAVVFGDSAQELIAISDRAVQNNIKFSLLFTSPPYCSITDYHADQWLRLWLLGGPENPKALKEKHKGRFVSKEEYYSLLDDVFGLCAKMMARKSTVYVRTDKRSYTLNTTLEILKKHFPKHTVKIIKKPLKENTKTQTKLYGDQSKKPGEVDIILTR
ncbi:site-specific DNA-methyltransferase [Sediminibacterium roseum]|uniref:site-specific DNA-methyltransferase (cytosine-N(4)-specific) n=1 Tax=Sediminibacterium roseum TaxID=1978412 RepID=A0ABW9ZUT2_9BACT|nr:DNA methyltransferase [Sediminibacterium roseum]NCI50913.1 site-specific DNA-methyltransferase [Sediminibacterium roseum]